MADLTAADFGDAIAERIRAEHIRIAARWLERLRGLLGLEPNQVFPTEHLLDHIPSLIQEVAEYVRTPRSEAVAANTWMTTKAQELGALRHSQRASVHQLLAEYRLLGSILSHFVQQELERLGASPTAAEALEVVRRLDDAIWILTQTTVDTFVSEYTGTIASHAARIESFNRMVSHELRQPLGALMYAIPLLKAEAARGERGRHDYFIGVLERNTARLSQLVEQLEALSRLQNAESDALDIQRMEVASIAWEVARQLREMADARGVEIQIDDRLPELMLDRARLELIFTNLISNAIKYSDPRKDDRFARVEPVAIDDPTAVCIAVRDNGLGIPASSLGIVFRRFERAHASRDVELGIRGSGLGLAIALECAEAVGGSLRVESIEGEGTSFLLTIPRDVPRPGDVE